MTKNRAAKERKREERKKRDRLRDEQRKLENVRAARLIDEGLDQGTARGLAALWCIPKAVLHAKERGEPRRALTSVPAFYASIKATLDRSGTTQYVEQYIDAMYDMHALSTEDEVEGVAFACHEDDQGSRSTATGMPPGLLYMSPAPEKWLERYLSSSSAQAVVWLVWRPTASIVLALDKDRNLALWFVGDDFEWHAATQAREFVAGASTFVCREKPKCELTKLFDLCGIESGPNGPIASADDPHAVRALQVYRHCQRDALRAFFHMASHHDNHLITLDQVAAENERVAKLERELAKGERRYAQLEQERDMARAALARARADSDGHAKHTSRPKEVALVERLASVFA